MAREEIGAWLAARRNTRIRQGGPELGRICSQVSDAALDAATGIILEEDLEEPDYEALFLPWTDAIEKLRVEKELQEIEGVADDDEVEEEEGDDEDDKDGAGDFGPNSDSVADFLNRLWLLSPEQVSRLVSGWQEAPQEELERAHEALTNGRRGLEERDQVRRAQEKISPG